MSAIQYDQPLSLDGGIGAAISAKTLGRTTFANITGLPDLVAHTKDTIDLATLQVSGGAGPGKDAKSDSNVESHEHPCLCDLQLPRKPLTSEQRHAQAREWHSGGSAGRRAKSPGSSSGLKRKPALRPAKRVASPTKMKGGPKKKRPGPEKKATKTRIAEKGGESRMAATASGKRTTARSRSRGPRIAVKLNRAATLRMEKGPTYCGKRPLAAGRMDRTDRMRMEMGRAQKQQIDTKNRRQRNARPTDAECPHRASRQMR